LAPLRQAAEELGLPRRTLADLVARGELPHVRVGRRAIYLLWSDIDAWVASRREIAA
jgi:excisionase family DNA binding protein